MYGLNSGDWTSYLRLVGVIDKGCDKVQQMLCVSSLQIKHDDKWSPQHLEIERETIVSLRGKVNGQTRVWDYVHIKL